MLHEYSGQSWGVWLGKKLIIKLAIHFGAVIDFMAGSEPTQFRDRERQLIQLFAPCIGSMSFLDKGLMFATNDWPCGAVCGALFWTQLMADL